MPLEARATAALLAGDGRGRAALAYLAPAPGGHLTPWPCRLVLLDAAHRRGRGGAGLAPLAGARRADGPGTGRPRHRDHPPHPLNSRPVDLVDGTIYQLLTDLPWQGDSLAAMRVHIVRRARGLARDHPEMALDGRVLDLLGAGRGAFDAFLAAVLEPRLRRTELRTPSPDPGVDVTTRLYPGGPAWHSLLPGMLASFDLDDPRPLFAGRDLVFVDGDDGGAVAACRWPSF